MAALSDPIADFLIRFKNATLAQKETFSTPHSKMKEEIARILKEEGYLWSYESQGEGRERVILAKPRYLDQTPALTNLKRVSRPGLRQYKGADEMPRVLGGMGIAIVSTSRGIMTGHKARKENVGGEVLAMVW